MPSLDAFVGLQLEDEAGIKAWLLAHRIRHGTYVKAASLQGLALFPYHLGSYPDDTWFYDHANAHLSLQPFMVPDQTVSLTLLQQPSWDNDDNFQAWMSNHRLIHQRLDQAFGVF